jgi:cytochrome c oxidase subunit 4
MTEQHHHITSYKTILGVLGLLIFFTLLSVSITQIELSRWATVAALLIAGVKCTFVLLIFMHLKYDLKIFKRMVFFIILLLAVVIFVTMLDFLFR